MRGMMMLAFPAMMWLAGCGGNDCECAECETAIDLCVDDEATCVDAAIDLCDNDTAAE